MPLPLNLLKWMGSNGPAVLFFGVLVGLVFPSLADFAHPYMATGVWLFTFGVFAKTNLAEFRSSARHPAGTACALVAAVIVAPLIAALCASAMGFPLDLAAGIALATAAPPSGAAMVAMLGLEVSLAVFVMIVAVMLSPVTLPWLVGALGVDVPIDSWALAERLAWLTIPPALAAFALKRTAPGFVHRNTMAATGMASLGLLIVALGAMRGIQTMVLASPWQAAGYLALAFALNLGLQALGSIITKAAFKMNTRDALTMGLCFGNRNISLVSAAAAPFLSSHPDSALFMAMSFLPIFILPQLQTLWMNESDKRRQDQNLPLSSGRVLPTTEN